MARLHETVAVVTGASRGAGRGIALVLGNEGATVYVTGRSVRGAPTTQQRPETIDETAEMVSARGGLGIPVRCDHTLDADVEALFERVKQEQGRLDLLVNNAWGGYEIMVGFDKFWEIPMAHWKLMFRAGVRYLVASWQESGRRIEPACAHKTLASALLISGYRYRAGSATALDEEDASVTLV